MSKKQTFNDEQKKNETRFFMSKKQSAILFNFIQKNLNIYSSTNQIKY